MVSVTVWGDYACFTRPEHKVERMTYPVMTPSAARGVLEAIAWKPEFSWRVRRIHVLRPIRHASIGRNEVASLVSERAARGWSKTGVGGFDAADDRRQRFSLVLRDVRYRIDADIVLRPHASDPIAKYESIFERRVAKGQSFHRPYLGTREFPAFFGPVSDEPSIDYSDELGRILFDVHYTPDSKGPIEYRSHGPDGGAVVRGRANPVFFRAQLKGGVLDVPNELYEESA